MARILDVVSTEPEPVFVVGMNGSGTSMLNESLGRHPELYAFPGEVRMIPHWIDKAPEFGALQDDENFRRLWEYVAKSSPDLIIFNNHTPLELPDNWREFPRSLAGVLDAVFRQFALRYGKSRWCEKSPNNSEHVARIAALFPRSKFIHIIRDGRDCAASTNRRQYRNPRLAIYRWRKTVAEARRQGQALGDRYMELRYEDLTTDPEPWMRKLCTFIGLEFDPAVLQSGMPQSARKSALKKGDVGRIEPNSRKFESYFNPQQLSELEAISGAFMHELGYDVADPEGNRELPSLEANLIRFADFVRLKWRLRSRLPWRQVISRTLASIREYSSKKI